MFHCLRVSKRGVTIFVKDIYVCSQKRTFCQSVAGGIHCWYVLKIISLHLQERHEKISHSTGELFGFLKGAMLRKLCPIVVGQH